MEPEGQQQEALQVLVLAQRTADEHVATARQQADGIRADARAAAEQMTREAQEQADGARREAEKILADARAQAEEIARSAQASADELEQEARRRYEEAVGGLAAERAALEQQVEALQQFDRDYRARLREFMQGQLRALDADERPADAATGQPGGGVTAPPPAQGSAPAQEHLSEPA